MEGFKGSRGWGHGYAASVIFGATYSEPKHNFSGPRLALHMGQTLNRAASWTAATDVGKGKLEFTPRNEAILNSIICFLEDFPNKHPKESKIIFKSALGWQSSLQPSDFNAHGYTATYYN